MALNVAPNMMMNKMEKIIKALKAINLAFARFFSIPLDAAIGFGLFVVIYRLI